MSIGISQRLDGKIKPYVPRVFFRILRSLRTTAGVESSRRKQARHEDHFCEETVRHGAV